VEGYDEATYGDRIADVYDDWYGDITDTAACVEALTRLARGGPVLELGVGTGRLAIPLASAGLRVTGVDSSAAMLERLAAKPGGEAVETVLGDMVDPAVGTRQFALVFAAYNTLFNLTGIGAQQRCLTSVAGLLGDHGRFVVEAFVPDPDRVGPTDVVVPRKVSADRVVLSVTRSRPDDQTLLGQYIDITEAGIRLRPWHIRYAAPDQLDAMAAAAGLVLESRSAGWRDQPFDDESATHISVYRRA
jgi:SAM-dependent methyltransferase